MRNRNKLDNKEADEMTMVVERLRQSKESIELAEAREGATAGREWAMRRASHRMLSEVARMAEENDMLSNAGLDDMGLNLALTLSVNLLSAYGEENEPEVLKEEMFSSLARRYSQSYVEAFMRAAGAVWEEVREQVELTVF